MITLWHIGIFGHEISIFITVLCETYPYGTKHYLKLIWHSYDLLGTLSKKHLHMASQYHLTEDDVAGISINPPGRSRVPSVYSEVQVSRIDHALPLPSVFKSPFKIVDGPPSSAAGNSGQSINHPTVLLNRIMLLRIWSVLFGFVVTEEIAKLFPNLYGQPSALLVSDQSNDSVMSDRKLKVGVVLSGGQAPGGHNVICGIFGLNIFFTFLLQTKSLRAGVIFKCLSFLLLVWFRLLGGTCERKQTVWFSWWSSWNHERQIRWAHFWFCVSL